MQRLVLCLLLGFGALALGAAGQAPPTLRTIYNREDLATLNQVSAYLNSIKTLQADFIQLGPTGRVDEGRLYISKPGRMRFEYRPPYPVLIVSDGRTVAVKNTSLNTLDRYALSDLPLSLILDNKIDLASNSAVLKVVKQNGTILVYARSVNTKTQGNIVLVFSEPQIELRQWSVTDNQGKTTTTTLRNMVVGQPMDQAKFVLPVKDAEPKKNPG